MLFLKSWLGDYVNLADYSNPQLAALINRTSTEVEKVVELTDYFAGKVVVGRIQNVRPHPNADSLQVFEVNLGSKPSVQLVSAAPNVRDGLVIPVALAGAKLPGFTIQARPLRGEESAGMGCGKSELTLETKPSNGLWELNSEFGEEIPLGRSICQALPRYFPEETLFDLSILPNRIGVFGSHLGLALELATILERPDLLTPKAKRLLNFETLAEEILAPGFFTQTTSSELDFNFTDETETVRSFGLFDVDFGADFYVDALCIRRLFLTETNVVGNLTDLSNYLLFDIGQPTHFFSKAKVAKQSSELTWKVRSLPQGQGFRGLGQLKKTTLPAGFSVLQDASEKVLALPGISGAHASKLDAGETEVVLEIANFNPVTVAQMAYALKYRSAAAKVWIGEVNLALTLTALIRLKELAPVARWHLLGLWFKRAFHSTLAPLTLQASAPIEVSLEKIAAKLDSRPFPEWRQRLTRILEMLGTYDGEAGLFYPNLFYASLRSFADVFEEVTRLVGFENLQTDRLTTTLELPATYGYDTRYRLRSVLVEFGFNEVITRPFVQETELVEPDRALRLQKAQNAQKPYFRTSLFPSLLTTLAQNLLAGAKNEKIFELNRVYFKDAANAVREVTCLDALQVSDNPYLLTTLVREIFRAAKTEFEVSPLINSYGQGYCYVSPTLSAELIAVKNSHKKAHQISLDKTVYFLHLDLSKLNGSLDFLPGYLDESVYPTLSRTYSFELSPAISWQSLAAILKTNTPALRVDLFPLERRHLVHVDTLTFRVDFVSSTHTLQGSEIEAWEKQKWAALTDLGDISLR